MGKTLCGILLSFSLSAGCANPVLMIKQKLTEKEPKIKTRQEKNIETKQPQQNRPYAAAIEAQKQGRILEACELYDKAGDPGLGGLIAEQNGHINLAYKLFKKAGRHDYASLLAQTRKEWKLALQILEEGELYVLAAQLCEKIGDSRAEKCYAKAAPLAEQAGYLTHAVQLYEKAKMFYKAGKIEQSRGEFAKALQLFTKADKIKTNEINLALELADELHKYDKIHQGEGLKKKLLDNIVTLAENAKEKTEYHLAIQCFNKASTIANSLGDVERAKTFLTESQSLMSYVK